MSGKPLILYVDDEAQALKYFKLAFQKDYEVLTAGSVTINGRKANPDDRLKTTDLLHNNIIALRRGKKLWHVTRWS